VKLRLLQFVSAAALGLLLPPGFSAAQGTAEGTTQAPLEKPAVAAPAVPAMAASKPPGNGDRRRAVKLFLASSKIFEMQRFEEAMKGYERAAKLDPTNPDYPRAALVARNHAVTALIQAAAKSRLQGDAAAARAALAHARELNPKSPEVAQHLSELGDDALQGQTEPFYQRTASAAGEAPVLAPRAVVRSFHMHTDLRELYKQIFHEYGIETAFDDSFRPTMLQFDLDDASFEDAAKTLMKATRSFYVPIDAHRVLVARDTRENRMEFEPQLLETVYLPGLNSPGANSTELADIGKLAKDVFNAQLSVVDASSQTITLRAPADSLTAFNATLRELLKGRNQIVLDVRMIQLARTNERNTGTHLMQTTAVYNLDAETQAILSQNAALIQQIIASGLAAPGDYKTILGILLASGAISSSLFSNGFATFGGGCPLLTGTGSTCSPTAFALAPGLATVNLNLNSSETRQLDQVQLRLGDGEEGKLRLGERYPIQTSSFSSIAPNSSLIAGLTGAGNSSALNSLLAQYTGGASNIPMIEYQDLGLTLKATPKAMRNNDVALTLDMKIDGLSGSSVNGNPVLDSRSYSGVVTLREGEGVVVVSELDKQQSRAVSGTPGMAEIPGLNALSDNDTQSSTATLLIVITPHVVRGTQTAGQTPMIQVDREAPGR
jgi:general secretion pathway protein D